MATFSPPHHPSTIHQNKPPPQSSLPRWDPHETNVICASLYYTCRVGQLQSLLVKSTPLDMVECNLSINSPNFQTGVIKKWLNSFTVTPILSPWFQAKWSLSLTKLVFPNDALSSAPSSFLPPPLLPFNRKERGTIWIRDWQWKEESRRQMSNQGL